MGFSGGSKPYGRARRGLSPLAAIGACLALLAGPRAGAAGILPLDAVKPGMTGYGLTVMKGDAVERFGVEVLGVLRNSAAGRSTIIVSLSGLGLEESGVVAGMSGSPVYLDGKLAGAVASGWGFSKRPIAGVTPIESMTGIVPAGPDLAGDRVGGTTSFAASASFLSEVAAEGNDERVARLRDRVLGALPEAPAASLLSLAATGFPAETLERFREPLARLGLPVIAGTGGTPAPAVPPRAGGTGGEPASGPLVPGASITAYLVRGDLVLGATGTVTDVFPDGRFVAFGHPFLGFGTIELPVARAAVVGVVPSAFQSFKIANGGDPLYRLTRDRDSGVGGRTDHPAPMIPARIVVAPAGAPERTFDLALASHPKLLPTLVALAADAAVSAGDPTSRERVLDYRISLKTAAGEIAYEDVATGLRAKEVAILTAAALVSAVVDNDVADPKVSAIAITFRSEPGDRRLRLVDAAPSVRRVAAGDTVSLALRLIDRRGADTVRVVTLEVPRDAPAGRAVLVAADGSSASSLLQSLRPVEPRTLAQFASYLSRLVPTNHLLAGLLLPSRGLSTGPDAITALPPTAAALLATSRAAGEPGGSLLESRLAAESILSFDRPVSGTIRVEIELERPRS